MLKNCRLNNFLTALIFAAVFILNAILFPRLLNLAPLTVTESVHAAPFMNGIAASSGPNSNMLQAESALERVIPQFSLPKDSVWNGYANFVDSQIFPEQAIWQIRLWQNEAFHYYAIVSANDGESLLSCIIECTDNGTILLQSLDGQPIHGNYNPITDYRPDYTVRIDDSGAAHIVKQALPK